MLCDARQRVLSADEASGRASMGSGTCSGMQIIMINIDTDMEMSGGSHGEVVWIWTDP